MRSTTASVLFRRGRSIFVKILVCLRLRIGGPAPALAGEDALAQVLVEGVENSPAIGLLQPLPLHADEPLPPEALRPDLGRQLTSAVTGLVDVGGVRIDH